eukprot:TRINITY_DN2144_c0_g1_i1.p1 TRINITY_DN2144_c0_g1~~TRINITY_DN2144_c0_g1_i1.p1  ORF type:complete len:240 (-),score=38.25 TRINITY_DN2144_c0_g1_i1:23-742(-)
MAEREAVKGGAPSSLFGVAENDSDRTSTATLNSDRTDRENPSVEQKGRSCTGCLFYSNTLRDSGRNPICIGVSRAESQSGYGVMGETEWEVTKDGKKLGDFKYACVGYSSHREQTSSPGAAPSLPPEGQAELPLCVGLEFLVDKRNRHGLAPAEEQGDGLPNPELQRDGWRDNGGHSNTGHHAPASARPHLSDDDFPSRFVRCAKLVATAVVRNAERVAGTVKSKVDDIIYPDRGKPKR